MTRLSLLATAAVLATAGAAFADGQHGDEHNPCPVEHRLDTPRPLEAPPDQGAVREVLSYEVLDGWRGVEGLALRIRRITVVPGGWVPLHWHDDRPSVDYIVSGELVEHNAFCAVPIVHHAGDSGHAFGPGASHWWVNETSEPVVLISADVVPEDKIHY